MVDDGLGWKHILRINLRLAYSCLVIGFGWLLFHAANKEWWGFWMIGGLAMLGGGMEFLAGFGKLFSAAISYFKLRSFKSKGVEARADRGVTHDDLKRHGVER